MTSPTGVPLDREVMPERLLPRCGLIISKPGAISLGIFTNDYGKYTLRLVEIYLLETFTSFPHWCSIIVGNR